MSRPQVTPSSPPLRVGVLYISPVQFLDAAALDIFGMLTKEYLQACNLPSPLLALGISVTIHHITASSIDTPISLTSNTTLHPTASLTTPSVQPGQLDVLLIPGPDPSSIPSSETQSFIRAHAAIPTCDILTICTGIFPAGHSGILKDRTCTGPRGLLSKLRSDFPGAKFQEKRWTRDGNLWTSAGITNGHDLVAAYIRERCSKELSDLVCAMADIGDRGQEYGTGNVADKAWWVGLIFRSLWKR